MLEMISLTSAVQTVHWSLFVLPEPEDQSHGVPRDVAGHVTRQRHGAVHHRADLSHGGVGGLEGGLGGDDHQEREENIVFVDHDVRIVRSLVHVDHSARLCSCRLSGHN